MSLMRSWTELSQCLRIFLPTFTNSQKPLVLKKFALSYFKLSFPEEFAELDKSDVKDCTDKSKVES